MTRPLRWSLIAVLGVAALFAAWRIVHWLRVDAAVERGDVAAVLRLDPDHAEALLADAGRRLQAGDVDGAERQARNALRRVPIDGRGYRVLAQVAERRKQPDLALALYRIAVARAPRDVQSRAWLAQHALDQRNYPGLLHHVDRVLALSPGADARLYPLLTRLSADPDFAEALAQALRSRPAWRNGMLAALQAGSAPAVADRVLSALQRNGGLDQAEFDGWIEGLMRQGRLGEAQARWAGPILASGRALPLLFNGDFASTPSGVGFDWRLPRTVGVLVEFEAAGAGGNVLRARFLGRRIAGDVASHALLLPPGRYRLHWRQRIDGMNADPGLEWRVACMDPASVLARSDPMRGNTPWKRLHLSFEVPAQTCAGQWLQLGNAGAEGAGQVIDGALRVADVRLERILANRTTPAGDPAGL